MGFTLTYSYLKDNAIVTDTVDIKTIRDFDAILNNDEVILHSEDGKPTVIFRTSSKYFDRIGNFQFSRPCLDSGVVLTLRGKVADDGIVFKKYYKNNVLHREDGPAMEVLIDNSFDTYYLDGKHVTYCEWCEWKFGPNSIVIFNSHKTID